MRKWKEFAFELKGLRVEKLELKCWAVSLQERLVELEMRMAWSLR